MIIAVDVETQGLNTKKYILATIENEQGTKKTFHKKEELWKYLIETGKKEQKRKRALTVYSHNAKYDFYSYAPLLNKGIKYHSQNPFIATYNENNTKIATFCDTMAIYRMNLKKVGELINKHKTEMPTNNLQKLEEYCANDTNITIESIKKIKQEIKNEGIQIRRLYTIHQIAVRYLINKLKQTNTTGLWENKKTGELTNTKNSKEIHSAYRGGRVEAFKLGTTNNVNSIDCNSLYPYAATKIKFPQLNSERKIERPLEIYTQKH